MATTEVTNSKHSKDVGKGTCTRCWLEHEVVLLQWKSVWRFHKEQGTELDSVHQVGVMESKSTHHRNANSRVDSSTVHNSQVISRPGEEWVEETCSTCTVTSHSAPRNEMMSSAGEWMELRSSYEAKRTDSEIRHIFSHL